MNSNTCSDGVPEGLQALAADVDDLATQDLDGLAAGVRAERVLGLRRLLDRLEGQWLASSPAWMAAGRPAPSRGPSGLDRQLAAGPVADGRRCRQ